ncbi:MAG: 4Fe-4S dicluster domain-containing protein [Candidatus Asgardarchaeia archaeon]
MRLIIMKIPGVMEKELLKSVVSKPATVNYPFEESPPPAEYRGMPELDIGKCLGCSACALNCPSDAIEMVPDERTRTKKAPKFLYARCITCGICSFVCPRSAITMTLKPIPPTYDKDELVGRA